MSRTKLPLVLLSCMILLAGYQLPKLEAPAAQDPVDMIVYGNRLIDMHGLDCGPVQTIILQKNIETDSFLWATDENDFVRRMEEYERWR